MKNEEEPDMPVLASKQHEADGCLLIHASNEVTIASQVIVQSPDTDVAVLCIHFCRQIAAELWCKTGLGKDV